MADVDIDQVVETPEQDGTQKGRGRPRLDKDHYAVVRQDMIDAIIIYIRKEKRSPTYNVFVDELCSPSTGERLTSRGKWPGLAKRMKKALEVDCLFSTLRAEALEAPDINHSTTRRARTVVFSRQQPNTD
jgi:hypothetical protein